MQGLENIINIVGNSLSDWLLIPLLLIAAIWFTIRTRSLQSNRERHAGPILGHRQLQI